MLKPINSTRFVTTHLYFTHLAHSQQHTHQPHLVLTTTDTLQPCFSLNFAHENSTSLSQQHASLPPALSTSFPLSTHVPTTPNVTGVVSDGLLVRAKESDIAAQVSAGLFIHVVHVCTRRYSSVCKHVWHVICSFVCVNTLVYTHGDLHAHACVI